MGFRINGTPYTPGEAPPVSVTVPMALPDGSVLFYDRGTSYGEYKINDLGYPERIDGAVDDGSSKGQNWRYLICDQHDLDSTQRQWGPRNVDEGITGTAIGVGLPNTETMLAKYADNDTYWWKLIKEKRDSTGFNWFMPSVSENNLIYDNKDIITSEGGDAFQTGAAYWSSVERDDTSALQKYFTNNALTNSTLKDSTRNCRLLRRV